MGPHGEAPGSLGGRGRFLQEGTGKASKRLRLGSVNNFRGLWGIGVVWYLALGCLGQGLKSGPGHGDQQRRWLEMWALDLLVAYGRHVHR